MATLSGTPPKIFPRDVPSDAMNDAEQSSAALVDRIHQALEAAGDLPGVSVSLTTAVGRTLSLVEDGQRQIPERSLDRAAERPVQAEPHGAQPGIFSFGLDDGDQIVVRSAREGAATARLVGAVLQTFFRALAAEKREELLLQELGANWESMEVLYEISTDALRSGHIKDAVQRLIQRLASLKDGLHSALFVKREGLFVPLASTGPELSSLAPEQLGEIESAMLEMRVALANRLGDLPQSEALDERVSWRNAASLAAAPFSREGCVGFVAVWSEDPGCYFDQSFARVLEAIAYQVAVMMASDRLNRKVRESQLLAQEVEIASSIQQTLLLANAPKDAPRFEIASCSLPSQRIDGDFHDFFQLPDGSIDVLIGDVMGKGVAAALLGAATKSQFLRATANLALQSNPTAPRPAEIVARAASRLSERLISLERFVTLCYARFDAVSRTLSFVDCGHTSMIVEGKAQADWELLTGGDLPLGVVPDFSCEERSVAFRPGQTYLLYSDGVTENRAPNGEMFGVERLSECVRNWSSLGPAKLVAQIRSEAVRFRGSEKFADDFTCIAVRIQADPTPAEPIARGSAVFPRENEQLARLRSWLRGQVELGGAPLSEDELARLELCCTEIFVNCVVHAGYEQAGGKTTECGPREDGEESPVGVEISIFPQQTTVELRHRGREFDPLAVPPPAFDGSRDGGFGIYIVLRSADQARFARDADGTNIITLTFLRSEADRSL